jgi:hypothetical protein
MIIGGPLAWLVVAAALIVLADTVRKYIQGKATLWDVFFAALDCIPMTKGITSLGKLAELYKAGGLLKIGAHALESSRTVISDIARGFRGFGTALTDVSKTFRESDEVLLRAVRRPRNGPPMPMTMDSVRNIATRYSVDLKGIRVNINKSVRGLCGSTPSATKINLYRDAFHDEEQLARTLAHERFHVEQIKRGAPIPSDEATLSAWEDEAYAHEDEWWANHPNNQPSVGGAGNE